MKRKVIRKLAKTVDCSRNHCLLAEGKEISEDMENDSDDQINTFDSGCITEHNEIGNADDNNEDISKTETSWEEDTDDEADESFKIWLKDVSECLQGFRKADPDKMQEAAEEELEEETDEERCMRIVRSVLDEETALEMVKTYLSFTKVFEEKYFFFKISDFRKQIFLKMQKLTFISVSLTHF